MYSSKQIKLVVPILLALISLIFSSCSNNVEEMVTFLDAKEAIYEDISIQMGEAYWNLYSDEAVADLDTPKDRYAELYTNDTLNSIINDWFPKRSKLKDKVLARRLEVWHNILTAAKINYAEENLDIQNELEFWFAEENDAEGRPSDDELREKLLLLMNNRNEQAHAMGYSNYGELILEVTELGADWLENFVQIIEERTREPYKLLIAELKEIDKNMEVDNSVVRSLMMQYYINQATPQLTRDSITIAMKSIVDGIGIDYDNLPFRVVENEMPPGVGGQGIAVQIPNDFRIALMPGLDLGTWTHELGHGLHGMHIYIESPILKGYEWSFGSGNGGYSEGMAETAAQFSRNISFIEQYSDMTLEQITESFEQVNKHRAAYLRYWLPILMFEVEFYKDLDQDPDELKRELIKKYRLLDNLPERVGPFLNIIYVSYPLYTQNYVIAEVLSWQIHQTLADKFGEDYALNPEIGQFLIDNFYKNGELLHWQERIKNATGKDFDLDGYLSHFGM